MKTLLVKAFLVFALPVFVFAQKDLSKLPTRKSNSFELRIDKTMTDEQLKQDETDAKKYDFDVTFTGIKRNDKKEITAIKIAYKDQDGNSGNYNVNDELPIKNIVISKNMMPKVKVLLTSTLVIQADLTMLLYGMVTAWKNMFGNDVFKDMMDRNKLFMQGEFNGADFDDLEKLKGDF